jgi:hypothetical protein
MAEETNKKSKTMEKLFIIDEVTLNKFAEKVVADVCARLNVAQCSNKDEQYISRKTASILLELDEATIWRYSKSGILKSYQVGNATRYKKSDIEKMIKEK